MIKIDSIKKAKAILKSLMIDYERFVNSIEDIEIKNNFVGIKYTYKQIMSKEDNTLEGILLDITLLNGTLEKEIEYIKQKIEITETQKWMLNNIKYLSLSGQANYLLLQLNAVNRQNKGLILSNNRLKDNNKELREQLKNVLNN